MMVDERVRGKRRPLASDVPRAPWQTFFPEFLSRWETGQHVVTIGPTGEGKSTLNVQLLKGRARAVKGAHTLGIVTKPRDETLSRSGIPRITKWPPEYGQTMVLLWPPYGDPVTVDARYRRIIGPVLRRVFTDGNRVIYFDEQSDLEIDLRLHSLIVKYLTKGRSNGLTILTSTQRPVKVARETFSEPSWAFIFQLPDEDERKRAAEIGGDRALIREVIGSLQPHEFLCVRRRTGEMVISKVDHA